MAADIGGAEQRKRESCGTVDSSVYFKIVQFPPRGAAKAAPAAEGQQPPSAAPALAGSALAGSALAGSALAGSALAGSALAGSALAGSALGLQTSSKAVMVIAKAAPPAQGTKTVLSQVASINQLAASGRAVMITVPRSAAVNTLTVSPQPPPAPQPANIQIPPGTLLIRSESGQLMLLSQQALTQHQQGPARVSGATPRMAAQQASAAATHNSREKVTALRMTPPTPPLLRAAPAQKNVVKVVGVASIAVSQSGAASPSLGGQPHLQTTITGAAKEPRATFSQETLESVKKCKNFLVTLIKLASSAPRAASMANNVRELVRALLEGKVEAEEFTEQLYEELKSTPQPCLVPFLKKSLPAVRLLTADAQVFIEQASAVTHTTNAMSFTLKQPNTDANSSTSRQVLQQPGGAAVKLRPTLTLLSTSTAKNSRPSSKIPGGPSGKHLAGTFSVKPALSQDPSQTLGNAFKDGFGTYKEDDDINDVASMAGVNLTEENAQILTTVVGSVVQSCQDQLFLSPNLLLSRILRAGQPQGVTDVAPDVVALISHATQERLHRLLVKLTVLAGHRKAALKEELSHTRVSDVRSQLRFLEEVETLKKRRKDEEARERLLRLARSRSHSEDPQHQQLKQRAKELQQMEEAELQQREANQTALAAIGPRKKRTLEQPESQAAVLPRPGLSQLTRVSLRELLLVLELEPLLCRSLLLYKALL